MCDNHKYRVFLLPEKRKPGLEGLQSFLMNEFDDFWQSSYVFDKTLSPGESCELTFAALYPSPTSCGVFPNVVFSQDEKELYQTCGSLMEQEASKISQLDLVLRISLHYGNYFGDPADSCIVIPCGQIFYPEH